MFYDVINEFVGVCGLFIFGEIEIKGYVGGVLCVKYDFSVGISVRSGCGLLGSYVLGNFLRLVFWEFGSIWWVDLCGVRVSSYEEWKEIMMMNF